MAGKKKLQKRVKAIGAQVEASIRQDGEDHKFQAAESAQLFQIDSKGGADLPLTKKQKLLVKDPMVKSRKFKSDKASKFEQDKLKKIKALQEQQKQQQQPVELKRAPVTATVPLKVWGNDGEVAAPAELAQIDEYVVPAVVKKVKRRKLIASTEHKIAKVQVAAPGQSYHPEFAAHQDVMAEAVSKELERREAIAEMGKPVRAGMSVETLQYIDQRGSDEESDSDEDDSDNDGATGKRKKMPGVITRSVRNKRSRHKQMELEHLQRRQEKAIIKQINAANHILQDIIRDEKSSEQKQELKKVLEEQKLEQEPDLVRVGGKLTKIVRETPVAFSEELTGNMRTLKPKGSLLLERYDSMHKRNMIQVNGPKSTRKRKVRIIEAKNVDELQKQQKRRGNGLSNATECTFNPWLATESGQDLFAVHPAAAAANFRHDKRGSRIVEIRMEEYERSKRSILKKIRFRLIVLGVLMLLLAVAAITLGIVVRSYHMKIVKFQRTSGGVRLRDLYFVYATAAAVFSFHGFYMDGNWDRLQLDGNRLIMHVRLYSLLGLGAWAIALWLGAATLSSFGLVEVAYITQSSPNLIYLSTLVAVCTHMLVAPWLLRTIHRKGSQADEYYGAEFMTDLKRPQRVAAVHNESSEDDDGNEGRDASDSEDDSSRRAKVVPAKSPRRGSGKVKRRGADGQKSRKAFYNADGTATVAMPVPIASAASSSALPAPSSSSSPRPNGVYDSVAAEVVQEGLLTSSHATNPEQIPFASPVFVMDREAHLEPSEFWRLWKQVETTGSFSCIFKNQPTKRDVETHLRAFGFHVVSCDAKDNVLQTYFYAHQLGSADVFFLCEFVLIYSRCFFQATFKCKVQYKSQRATEVDAVTDAYLPSEKATAARRKRS